MGGNMPLHPRMHSWHALRLCRPKLYLKFLHACYSSSYPIHLDLIIQTIVPEEYSQLASDYAVTLIFHYFLSYTYKYALTQCSESPSNCGLTWHHVSHWHEHNDKKKLF